ncbi:hypothetical protein M413DRAFT_392621 [Hebeloma cylindrosporum]|uniref:Uncharacterized protein n=1 Tax=Hebeloma cylindrosporum TaxID=76867 RepID=A0A0C3C1Z5_HEBCY|nr:hypothetical protein M413DRAFT_392621 [Hebeloma cylindrosporum h7]
MLHSWAFLESSIFKNDQLLTRNPCGGFDCRPFSGKSIRRVGIRDGNQRARGSRLRL